MIINKMISGLVLFIFFMLSSFFSTGVFASQKTALVIDDALLINKHVDSEQILVFNKSENKQLTIENRSKYNLELLDVSFIGDTFTFPLMVRDFSVHGFFNGVTVNSNTSYSVAVSASQKAVPTLSSKGMPLFLRYRVVGEEDIRAISLKVKSSYNNDLKFEKRDVEFKEKFKDGYSDGLFDSLAFINNTETQSGLSRKNFEADLTLINKSKYPINIKRVELIKLTKEGEYVGVGNAGYHGCKPTLMNKKSCKLTLSVDVDEDDIKSNEGVFPIWVYYERLTPNGVEDGLLAVAAGTFDYKPKLQPVQLIVSGTLVYASILLPNLAKDFFVGKLGDSYGKSAISLITGGGFVLGDLVNSGFGYNGESTANSYLSSSWMYSLLESTGSCTKLLSGSKFRYLSCILAGLSIRLPAKFLVGLLLSKDENHLLEDGLPGEKNKIIFAWDKINPMVDFGATAFFRVSGKYLINKYFALAFPEGWYDREDIHQDFISGMPLVMVDIVKLIFSNSDESSISKEAFVDSKCGEECICSKLDDEIDEVLIIEDGEF